MGRVIIVICPIWADLVGPLLMKLRIMKYSISQIRSQLDIRALPTGSDRFHNEGYAVGSSCILSQVQDTISSVDCQRDVSVWGRAAPGVSRLVGRDASRQMPFASQTHFRVTPLTATVSRNYRQWHRPMNVCGRSSGGGPEPTSVHQLRKSKAHPYQEGVT